MKYKSGLSLIIWKRKETIYSIKQQVVVIARKFPKTVIPSLEGTRDLPTTSIFLTEFRNHT